MLNLKMIKNRSHIVGFFNSLVNVTGLFWIKFAYIDSVSKNQTNKK